MDRSRMRSAAGIIAAAVVGLFVGSTITSTKAGGGAQQWLNPPMEAEGPYIVQITGVDNLGFMHRLWSNGRIQSADCNYLGLNGPAGVQNARWQGWAALPN